MAERPSPTEAILDMQQRHKLALEMNGIIAKVIDCATQERRPDDYLEDITKGWPVVLGSTDEEITQVYIAFQRERGASEQSIASRIIRIGAVALDDLRPNVLIGMDERDLAVVNSLYNDAQILKRDIAPEYNTELGL